jgi:hypothetical protein
LPARCIVSFENSGIENLFENLSLFKKRIFLDLLLVCEQKNLRMHNDVSLSQGTTEFTYAPA